MGISYIRNAIPKLHSCFFLAFFCIVENRYQAETESSIVEFIYFSISYGFGFDSRYDENSLITTSINSFMDFFSLPRVVLHCFEFICFWRGLLPLKRRVYTITSNDMLWYSNVAYSVPYCERIKWTIRINILWLWKTMLAYAQLRDLISCHTYM